MLTRYRFTVGLILSLGFAILGLAFRNAELALLSIPPMFYCSALLISAALFSTPGIEAHRQVDRTRIPEEENIGITVSSCGSLGLKPQMRAENRCLQNMSPGSTRTFTWVTMS